MARNTVRAGRRRGRYVEFWALDRRSNCLEDHTGVDAAARAKDPSIASATTGAARRSTASGSPASQPSSVDFLRAFGLERTVRDWHAVIEAGFPDPAVRTRKVICGGHSLGGPLTTAFAGWDFDGDPRPPRTPATTSAPRSPGFDTRFALGLPAVAEGSA